MTDSKYDQNLTYEQMLNIKVYSRWVTDKLKTTEGFLVVNDVINDLKDGILLLHLAKALTKNPVDPKLLKKALGKQKEVEKLNEVIKMFNEDGIIFGVKQNTVCGEDINNGNVKQILYFFWVLIKNYSIDRAVREDKLFKFDKKGMDDETIEKTNKIQLLKWATNKIQTYDGENSKLGKNFAPYDLSLCALLHSYLTEFNLTDEFNYDTLDKSDHDKNLQIANQLLEKIGVPVYIYPEDINKDNYQIDDSSLMTQLSAIKIYLDKKHTFRDSVIQRNPELYQKHLASIQADRQNLIQAQKEREKLIQAQKERERLIQEQKEKEQSQNENQSNDQKESEKIEEEEQKEDEVNDYDDEEDEKEFRKLFEKEIHKYELKWQKEMDDRLDKQKQLFKKEMEEKENYWKSLLEEQKNMFLGILEGKVSDKAIGGKSTHKKIKLTIKSKYSKDPERLLSLTDNNDEITVSPIFADSTGKKLKVKVRNENDCIEKTYNDPASGLKIVLNENK